MEIMKFKENKSLAGQKGNAVRWQSDRPAFASAFASASALKTKEEPINLSQTLSQLGKEKAIPKATPSDWDVESIKKKQRAALEKKMGIAL
jgi:hypothetical protein